MLNILVVPTWAKACIMITISWWH